MAKQNILKKLILLTSSLSVTFSALLCAPNAGAAFSDVGDDDRYKTAITMLSKLNVIDGYDDGEFKQDNQITRAEFTKIMVYMLGFGELPVENKIFEDVPDSHWASSNIATAHALGLVNGITDTEFGPDDRITYEQALTIVIRALGYRYDAEAKGEYPEGYRLEAAALDLTKNIDNRAFPDDARRGDVAQIMYNALEIKMNENDGTGKWVTTDKTLLNDYLKVKKLKGMVVGVEDSITSGCDAGALNAGLFAIDDDSTGEEYIINYTEYTDSIADMTPYLGKTIQIYYRDDERSADKRLVEIDSGTYEKK